MTFPDHEEVPYRPETPTVNSGKRPIELVRASSISLGAEPRYYIKGLVHQGDLSMVYGPSGCGKTFLALYIANAVASGQASILGRRVRQGRVALFALEGAGGLGKRVKALEAQSGATDNLFVYRGPLQLFRQETIVRDVIAAILECQADVVIFDTLARTMSGANENSPEDMTHMLGVFAKIQAATGAHVMLVHHSGKDKALGARGHSSLRAAVDVELEVAKDEKGERTVQVTKGRDDADGDLYGFRLNSVPLGDDEDGDPITTCVVEELGTRPTPVKAAKLSNGDKLALSWLKEAVEEFGEVPPLSLPAGIKAVTKDKWTSIGKLRSGGRSEDAVRKAIERATTNLQLAKAIAVHSPYFWLTREA